MRKSNRQPNPTIASAPDDLDNPKRAARLRARYLVTILGRKRSRYSEERLRTLKTNPKVLLWLESDAGNKYTVLRREGKTLKSREPLRGQRRRAIESLFRNPVQKLARNRPTEDACPGGA